MKIVFGAKMNFDATIGEMKELRRQYIQLNATKYCGKDHEGKGVFENYRITVWGQYDIQKASAFRKGDIISFVISNDKPLVDKGGYPYVQGNVVEGMLEASFMLAPSQSIYDFFAAQKAAKERRREERQQTTVQPAAVQAVTVQPTPAVQATVQPATVQPTPVTPATVQPTPVQTAPTVQPVQPVQPAVGTVPAGNPMEGIAIPF